jgi:hypothetical protein
MWFTLVKVCFSVKVKLGVDGLVTVLLDEVSRRKDEAIEIIDAAYKIATSFPGATQLDGVI